MRSTKDLDEEMHTDVARGGARAIELLSLVDAYLDGFLRTQALRAALDLGLVDALLERAPRSLTSLASSLAADVKLLGILTDLLVRHEVLEAAGDALSLHPRFVEALGARDLIEVRIDYANRVGRAMIEHYPSVIRDPARNVAKIIDFFLFDPSPVYSEATRAITRDWVRYMSTLTRYQAPVCADYHDFGRYRTLLDVGGNNGEHALHLCRRHPDLEVTVLDLPAVCDLGEAHVARAGLSDRVRFVRHDLRQDELPRGYDAIVFKSVLHDWDDTHAALFLRKACDALSPGGELVVVEFHAYDLRVEALPERDVVNVPFLSFLRPADTYERLFRELGLAGIERVEIAPLHFTLTRGRR